MLLSLKKDELSAVFEEHQQLTVIASKPTPEKKRGSNSKKLS